MMKTLKIYIYINLLYDHNDVEIMLSHFSFFIEEQY